MKGHQYIYIGEGRKEEKLKTLEKDEWIIDIEEGVEVLHSTYIVE